MTPSRVPLHPDESAFASRFAYKTALAYRVRTRINGFCFSATGRLHGRRLKRACIMTRMHGRWHRVWTRIRTTGMPGPRSCRRYRPQPQHTRACSGSSVAMVARPMAIGTSAIVIIINHGARYTIEENQDSTCLSIWNRYLLNRLGPYHPYDPATNKLQASAVRSR